MLDETATTTTETPATVLGADPAAAPVKTDAVETVIKDEAAQPDWRTALAGDNADRLKLLQRFTDPGAFVESFENAQKTIRESGRVKVPGADATPEDIAAWNKARGVPEAPDKYVITAKPPEGLELSEPEAAGLKTTLAGITERLHKLGAEPAVVNAAHELVYEQAAADKAQRAQVAVETAAATTAALKQKWGADYDANLKYANQALVQNVGPEMAQALIATELADGSLLGANPAFIEALAKMGLQFREDPNFLEDPATTTANISDEIKKIMELRLTPAGEKTYALPETQARLQKLIAQRDSRPAKAA